MVELSIVICTRNRAEQLAAALEALTHVTTKRAWEIVLVDNGSTDRTAETIEAARTKLPNLRHVAEPRIGLGAARDRGWREASGRLIAMTDDDCYVAPDYVDAVIAAFEDHPAVGCIGGRILLYDPADAHVTLDTRDRPVCFAPHRFIAAGQLQGANLCFRRTTLERIGGIDPELGAGTDFPCEDIDAIAAALWAGIPARFDPRPIVHHHHGRRLADIPALEASYDRGRGAYYAKYLIRVDTRWPYVAGWLRMAFLQGNLARLRRELASARRYIAMRERRLSALLAVILVAGVPLVIAGRILARGRGAHGRLKRKTQIEVLA